MGGLFSKSSSNQDNHVTEQDKAIMEVMEKRDKVHKYIKQSEKSLEKKLILAKKCLAAGNKQRAIVILRYRKYQQGLLDSASISLDNLKRSLDQIEFSKIQQEVAEGLKKSTQLLEEINKTFSLDEIENIMEDSAQAREYQEQVSSLISGNSTLVEEIDDATLEAELNKILLDEQTETVPPTQSTLPVIPSVPSHEIAVPDATSTSTTTSSTTKSPQIAIAS